MTFGESIKTCFSKYVTFSGRAQRSEFWWWTLFTWVTSMVLSGVDSVLFGTVTTYDGGFEASTNTPILSGFFSLAILLPSISVAVRRLHDTGRTGAWIMAPWVLNGLSFWGAMIARPDQIRALGLEPIDGDPWLGAALMFGSAIGLVLLSLAMLIWMLKSGTRGDNFYGPDPRPGAGSYSDSYAEAYGAPAPDPAAAAVAQQRHREEISALYRQRVLGNPGSRG